LQGEGGDDITPGLWCWFTTISSWLSPYQIIIACIFSMRVNMWC